MKNSVDLTKGSIYRNLLLFGVPIFFSLLLQSFYNVVDMLIVGRFVGSAGTAALGNVSSVIWIVNAIGAGVAVGGTVLVSHFIGSKDKKSQKETIGTLFSFTIILSVIVTIATVAFYKPMFNLMNVPEECMEYACDYMFVICTGWVFVFGYNSICAVLKGLGDSKSPLYFMVVATVVNIVLDIIFVGPLHMGPKGAAIATVIAEVISFVLSLIALKFLYFKDEKIKFLSFNRDKFTSLLKIGAPTTGQMVVSNISFLFVSSMLNIYGVAVASAAGTGMKILTLMTAPCWAIGQTVCAMVGQNAGSGNIERVKKTCKIGVRVNVIANVIVVAIFQIFAKHIFLLFDKNPEVISNGVQFMWYCCTVDCILYAVMFTYNMFAVGLGYSTLGLFNSLFDSIVMRIIVCWTLGLVLGFGVLGIYWGFALSSVIPAIIGYIYFKSGRWQRKFFVKDPVEIPQ